MNLGCAEDLEDAIASPPWNPPPPRWSPSPERPAKKRRVEASPADGDEDDEEEDNDEEDDHDEPTESDDDAVPEEPDEDADLLA